MLIQADIVHFNCYRLIYFLKKSAGSLNLLLWDFEIILAFLSLEKKFISLYESLCIYVRGSLGSKHRSRIARLQAVLSEKAMAPASSPLAWKIPWTEETGGLQSMGSLRVGHN